MQKELDQFSKELGLSEIGIIRLQDLLNERADMYIDPPRLYPFDKPTIEEIGLYAETLKRSFNEDELCCYRVNACVYTPKEFYPFNLVVLKFEKKDKPLAIKSSKQLEATVNRISASLSKDGDDICEKKDFRFYDKDKIYIIKKPRKLLWTRSRAIDDAHDIFIEIANME